MTDLNYPGGQVLGDRRPGQPEQLGWFETLYILCVTYQAARLFEFVFVSISVPTILLI